MRWRRVIVMAAAVACLLGMPRATSAQASRLSDLNLPYLHYFGFGAFRIGEQEVWTLRGRWTPVIRDHEDRSWGIAARLTGSVAGIRGPTLQDEIESIGVAGATVGVEVRVPLSSRSLIRAYTDWGAGFDLDNDNQAALGILGAMGEFVFPWKAWELGLQPSVDLSASASSTEGLDDRLLAVQLRMDARHHLNFHILGNRAQAGIYADVARFWGDTDLNASTTETGFADNQFELGVIFGSHPRPRIVFIRPLLTVGFRWGNDFRGVRIGIGDRLTRLPPIP